MTQGRSEALGHLDLVCRECGEAAGFHAGAASLAPLLADRAAWAALAGADLGWCELRLLCDRGDGPGLLAFPVFAARHAGHLLVFEVRPVCLAGNCPVDRAELIAACQE